MTESDTYSVAEAARMLGVAERTLRRAIASGTAPVPALRIGRTLRIPKVPLDRLLGLEE